MSRLSFKMMHSLSRLKNKTRTLLDKKTIMVLKKIRLAFKKPYMSKKTFLIRSVKRKITFT